MNVATLVRRVAADHAGQVALRLDDREVRYGHLVDTAARAVIGTAHERWVEQVTAVVVPVRPGVTADDVAAWCAANPNLSGMHRPRRIKVVDALPRTGSGKLNRPELRKLYP